MRTVCVQYQSSRSQQPTYHSRMPNLSSLVQEATVGFCLEKIVCRHCVDLMKTANDVLYAAESGSQCVKTESVSKIGKMITETVPVKVCPKGATQSKNGCVISRTVTSKYWYVYILTKRDWNVY